MTIYRIPTPCPTCDLDPCDCVQDEPDYCGCCGNEITDHRIGVVQSWCGPCCQHIATRGPSWERTYEAINGVPCPFQVGAA